MTEKSLIEIFDRKKKEQANQKSRKKYWRRTEERLIKQTKRMKKIFFWYTLIKNKLTDEEKTAFEQTVNSRIWHKFKKERWTTNQ